MPAEPGPAEQVRERLIWMDTGLWRRGRAKAAANALDLTRVLESLLTAYADGRVTIDLPPAKRLGPTRNGDKRAGCRTAPLPDAAWDRANARREATGIKSMPVVCELLVGGYVDGHLTVTVTAAGHVPATTGEEGAAA